MNHRELNEEELKIYSDFKQIITEGLLEYNITEDEYIIQLIMKRIDQPTFNLYLEWGVNDTVFRDEVQCTIMEVLNMRASGNELYMN